MAIAGADRELAPARRGLDRFDARNFRGAPCRAEAVRCRRDFQAGSAGCGSIRYAEWAEVMTSREAVRTAIVIGGVWLTIYTFASVASLFVGFAEITAGSDHSLSDSLTVFVAIYLPSALGGIVTGSIPGIYAVLSSHEWAARLVPHDDSPIEVQPSLILSVGAMLLGISTGVGGAVTIASNGLVLAMQVASGSDQAVMAQLLARQFAFGLCSLIAGILVFRWGSRGVLRAA